MHTLPLRRVPVIVMSILGMAAGAAAQQTPAPLTVERVHVPWVVAPDFKVTEVDGDTGQLAGLYGGRILEGKVLVGGAMYWLANGTDTFRLTYGGLLVGWSSPQSGRIRFGVRSLAGVGTATLPVAGDGALFERGLRMPPGVRDVRDLRFGPRQAQAPGMRPGLAPSGPRGFTMPLFRFGVRDDFLVFEPQGTLSFDLTNHAAVTLGAGYRTVALTDTLRDRVDGPTASVGLEFDW